MRSTLVLLCLGFAFLVSARAAGDAEEMPLYEGAWSVRLDPQQAAQVTLRGWEGTWRWTGPAHDGCRGKAMPITIQHSTASVLEFTAWGSTISRACPDVSLSLKPLDARLLEGTSESGSKVRMVRSTRRRK